MQNALVLILLCSALLEIEAIQRLAKLQHEGTDQKQPNILYILFDDWGWGDVNWHRNESNIDSAPPTPNMDKLKHNGIELDRHYVFRVCSPTRSAIQSGRNPLQVNIVNFQDYFSWNMANNVSGFAGIPLPMTGIAEHLSTAGYETHLYGKWDAGMATRHHTPKGKGYKHSLSYWGHGNDMWNYSNFIMCQREGQQATMLKELWDGDGPALDITSNTEHCTQSNQTGCTFEEVVFKNRVMNAIQTRPKNRPFFIMWAPHLVHVPLQIPQTYEDKWKAQFKEDRKRRLVNAMVEYADDEIGEVVQLIHNEGIWEDTLIVMHSDNGGYLEGASSNYPLKGGKNSNWDGGIRVNALVSGGFLPPSVRGTKMEGLVAGWDWYATFAALAGVDPEDKRAAAAGLPAIDSYNMWPMISGQSKASPRKYLVIGDTNDEGQSLNGSAPEAWVGGLISGEYKLLVGKNHQASWSAPDGPTMSQRVTQELKAAKQKCGHSPGDGCLYNIYSDPEERNNIASSHPDIFNEMIKVVVQEETKIYNPDRGQAHPAACMFALQNYDGFLGPFVWESMHSIRSGGALPAYTSMVMKTDYMD